ncbi:Hypothetical_protein [Hexamita inflata]|uniref:Hypothetical_protein n=1 Tax=Hexamita inflata TaxID=28002 RepID=A0AA86NWV6_9EUKA|nr:Hypothetical protein HINF_LOCUS14974 [Hexamita inflata]
MLILTLQVQLKNELQTINLCDNTIYKGKTTVNFCLRQSALTSYSSLGTVIMTNKIDSSIFLDVGAVQKSNINFRVNIPKLSSFALFGVADISVISCSFSIQLLDEVENAETVCGVCSVNITQSDLQMNAFGHIVTGAIKSAAKNIIIQQSTVQLRTNATVSSIVVMEVNMIQNFTLNKINLTAHYFNQQDQNSIIISFATIQLIIQVIEVQFCILNVSIFGIATGITLSNQLILNCYLCEQGFVYGLCSDQLIFGDYTNGYNLSCVFPFEFNGVSCACADGYIINVSSCVDIISKISQLQQQVNYDIIHVNNTLNNIIAIQRTDINELTKSLNNLQTDAIVNNQLHQSHINYIISNITAINMTATILGSDYANSNNSFTKSINTIQIDLQTLLTNYVNLNIISVLNHSILQQSIYQIQQQIETLQLNSTSFQQQINNLNNSFNTTLTNEILNRQYQKEDITILYQQLNSININLVQANQSTNSRISSLNDNFQVSQTNFQKQIDAILEKLDAKADKKQQCTETFQSDSGASFNYPFYNQKELICCSALHINGYSPAHNSLVFSYICQNYMQAIVLQDNYDIVQEQMTTICGKWPCNSEITGKYFA